MRRDRLETAIRILGGLLALAAAVLGLIIGFGDDWDSNGERALWFVLTLGGATILAAGLWYAVRAPSTTAAVLIVVGALVSGFMSFYIFWSIVMPIAAVTLAVMTLIWARRPRVAAG